MTPEDALQRSTHALDEATENLTFEETMWALEEAWIGVAWALNAISRAPERQLPDLIEDGLPQPGTLSAQLAFVDAPPASAAVVRKMETLCQQLGSSDTDVSPGASLDQISDLVFSAWQLHDDCSKRLGLVDERLGAGLMLADVSPGRVGSQVLDRRQSLKLILAGSVVPLQACSKIERDNSVPAAKPTPPKANIEATKAAVVKAVEPLRGTLWKTNDPFLFCAYHDDSYPAGNENLGPAASLEGRNLGRDFEGKDNWRMYHGRTVPGFPRHPHRGFETVTVVRQGLLDHSDSMGAAARYGGGDVQWLTAGRGIQHSEMFPLLNRDATNPLELFQIWLNLPAEDKLVDPHFTMLWNHTIPKVRETDSQGRVTELTLAAGRYKTAGPPSPPPNSWASRASSEVAIWTIKMAANAEFVLPEVSAGTRRTLYLHRGVGAQVSSRRVSNNVRIEVEERGPLHLKAGAAETEFLLLQGRPIGEPVAKRGPFVMNTQAEIRQAFQDYRQTNFGGWSWRDNGPVHARKGRFARHMDGRMEEPGKPG